MNISNRDRSQLKSYFVTDAVPTEEQFGELIDGMINQKDDGLVKQAGGPLCIEAAGDSESVKQTLHLYDSFLADDPVWDVRLNPRINPDAPASARRGLSIHDANGKSRLFIDAASGSVGVGTIEPKAALDVAGAVRCTTLEVTAPEPWQNAALVSPWVRQSNTFAPPGFFKDLSGMVHLRGGIMKSNDTLGLVGAGVMFFRLPVGYRPAYEYRFVVYSDGSNQSHMLVGADGAVMAGANIAKSGTSLDGIRFRAEQ